MKCTVCRQLVPRRGPERQVSPRRVTDENHALKVEATLWRQLTKKVRGLGQVVVRPRPAAPIVSNPTILDIPSGNSTLSEGSGQRSECVQRRRCLRQLSEFGQPAAAMHEDGDGMTARPVRHA